MSKQQQHAMRMGAARHLLRQEQSTRPQELSRAPMAGLHPITMRDENAQLFAYEQRSKQAFDKIEEVLKRIARRQQEVEFVSVAQEIAQRELGFSLPEEMLVNTWITPLNVGELYAWCVFKTFEHYADEFFSAQPLAKDVEEFQKFIEQCGFHTMDISPCADGRLAHIIRYVLRLPYQAVRRKSYAGAMFDVEDSLQKWMETEFTRQREGVPNGINEPTRYLKVAVYHYSDSQPDKEGCAAHGSDAQAAAQGAFARLLDFQQAVENSFCCGASIDLLLIGLDTDSDAIRVHIPHGDGYVDVDCYVDAREVYDLTRSDPAQQGEARIAEIVKQMSDAQEVDPTEGMVRLIARLLANNISQIDYVRQYFSGCYEDIGHQERFIGMGIGFEEVQLRNLTYFAYLTTVEQGARDLDVGMKIFSGLTMSRGLPAPVIIRHDYHGKVPGAKERSVQRCKGLEQALRDRYQEKFEQGLVQTLLVVRDCHSADGVEVVGGTLQPNTKEDHHA